MWTRRRSLALLSVVALLGAAGAQARPHRVSRDEMQRIIRDCERRTDDFRSQLDRALDHSHLDGSHREGRLNGLARQLENEIDTVKREFERHEEFMDIRANVERALDAGREIDAALRRERLAREAERAWRALRVELNVLADHYRVRGLR